MLHCDNDTYYTGYTTDLERRYQEHVKGSQKAKYTRSFKPLCLARAWHICGSKSVALKIEKWIKKKSKKEKKELIQFPERLMQVFKPDETLGLFFIELITKSCPLISG